MCCVSFSFLYFFFFKQKTAYEMRISDWSSDVCSSDLDKSAAQEHVGVARVADPEGQLVEWNERDVKHRRNGADRQRSVDDRDAERPQPGGSGRLPVAALHRRKDEEDQAEHEGKMDPAVHGLLQKAEACGRSEEHTPDLPSLMR